MRGSGNAVGALADWLCALFVTAALGVALLGAAEALNEENAAAASGAAGGGEGGAGKAAFTVAVDAGHGGFDGGAVGAQLGAVEAPLNLDVAARLAAGLTAQGFSVTMTRETDEALAETKKADIKRRKALIGQSDIDLVVSIHMNSFPDASVSGPMAYYMLGSAEGQKLAQKVIDCLTDAAGRERRLANPGDYFIIRECVCPAVLVECGFLSNAADEKRLSDAAYRQALADAVAAGVCAYWEDAYGQRANSQ